MGEVRVARECDGCNRIVLIPAEWGVTDYLCLACRRRLAECPPDRPARAEAAGA